MYYNKICIGLNTAETIYIYKNILSRENRIHNTTTPSNHWWRRLAQHPEH